MKVTNGKRNCRHDTRGDTSHVASPVTVLADSAWDGAQLIEDYDDGWWAELPDIAMDGSNAVVVWVKSNNSSSPFSIEGTYSTDGGVTWGSVQPVSTGTSSYRDAPQMALSGDNAVAVWYEVVGVRVES